MPPSRLEGLDWPGARLLSAERILNEMDRHPQMHQRQRQGWGMALPGEGMGEGDSGPQGDVLDLALEKEWFPEDTAWGGPGAGASRGGRQGLELAGADGCDEGPRRQPCWPGGRPGSASRALPTTMGDGPAAVAGVRRPWRADFQPPLASRRRPPRCAFCPAANGKAGRCTSYWTPAAPWPTNSPAPWAPIADFCAAVGVDQVHLVQCDTEVGRDEVLAPAEVSRWQVTGYGGSDLTPAMNRLAEDPQVTAAVVLTDGDITYPESPVPYGVLWVLPPWKNPQEFNPGYGKVIAMGGPVSSA